MIWTREAPTKPGWYWWRRSGRLWAKSCLLLEDNTTRLKTARTFMDGFEYVDEIENCEWSDRPIPEPGEAMEKNPTIHSLDFSKCKTHKTVFPRGETCPDCRGAS